VSDAGAERTVLIRRARPDDVAALARLAELDEAPVPPGPLLVGEVDGRLWAAVSLAGLDHIADPFQPSRQIAELILARARQLGGRPGGVAGPVRGRRWWRSAVRETVAGERP
jgi:hypothetical protein